MPLLPALARWWRRTVRPPKPIPERLWQATLVHYAFLQRLSAGDQARLRRLATHFLAHKEFSGAHGLRITDAMAVAVAAQACLPLLHLGPPDTPEDALGVYGPELIFMLYRGLREYHEGQEALLNALRTTLEYLHG